MLLLLGLFITDAIIALIAFERGLHHRTRNNDNNEGPMLKKNRCKFWRRCQKIFFFSRKKSIVKIVAAQVKLTGNFRNQCSTKKSRNKFLFQLDIDRYHVIDIDIE
jgi:hypothetical protein